MEKQTEELKWIDGIFLTERPVVKGHPVLGKLVIEHPTDEILKQNRSSGIILTSTKDIYAVGDELYARVLAVHPDEPGYKVGDYVVVPAPGTICKFSKVICEIVSVHVVLHKLN